MAVAARHPPCAKGGQTAEGGQGGLTALSYIIDTSCRVWGFWLGALNPPSGADRHPPLHKGGFFAALHTTSFSETLGGEPPLPYSPRLYALMAQVLRQRDAGPITFFAFLHRACLAR